MAVRVPRPARRCGGGDRRDALRPARAGSATRPAVHAHPGDADPARARSARGRACERERSRGDRTDRGGASAPDGRPPLPQCCSSKRSAPPTSRSPTCPLRWDGATGWERACSGRRSCRPGAGCSSNAATTTGLSGRSPKLAERPSPVSCIEWSARGSRSLGWETVQSASGLRDAAIWLLEGGTGLGRPGRSPRDVGAGPRRHAGRQAHAGVRTNPSGAYGSPRGRATCR